MFDFLNKLSHNHNQDSTEQQQVAFDEISSSGDEQLDGRALAFEERSSKDGHQKSQLITSIKKIQREEKKEKKIERGQSIVGKMQIKEKLQLHPNALAIFKQQKLLSEKGSSSYLLDKLREVVAGRERKVYIRQMARDQDQYLHQAQKCAGLQSNYIKQELESTFMNIFNSISFDIESQNIPIHMKRQKHQDSQKEKNLQTLKMIRKRQSQLHGKIGQLSVELSYGEQAAEKRALEILNKDQFSPDDYKTKLAEDFVKEKQREREEMKAKLEEYKQKKRMAELIVIETNEQQKQRLKRQRHEKITREFQEKQRLRAQQKQKAKKDQKQFKQFLKDYNQAKPLYQKLQENFKKREKQQKRQRLAALRQKQAKFEPINLQTLQMHQQKYQQLRKEDRQRKQAQLEYSRQKERLLKHQLDHNIYKGRFRYIVLQQMVDNQAKKKEKQLQKKAILQKKKAFSEQVRQYFQPIVDPSKRMEIQQRINSHRQRKRKYATPNRVAYSDRYSTISTSHPQSEPQADPRRQGKKYHHMFKQYIRTKIQKGEVKSDEQASQDVMTVKKAPNYLKQLRQKYQGQIPSRSARLQKQIRKLREGDDYGSLVLKAQEYDHRAKQQEKKLRNSAHVPSEQARLQQDYLCAIKAKMELINSIQ